MAGRNHVYIVKVYIPKFKSDKRMLRVKRWVKETYKKYLDSNSTVYTSSQINALIKEKYHRRNRSRKKRIRFCFSLDVSEEEAFNAMSASSMESNLDDIKPLNKILPHQSYLLSYKKNNNFKCSICLENDNELRIVTLKRCKCMFHRDCIKLAHMYDKRCPLCSKQMCRISKEPVDCTI
jgi:hypothetical protein